MKKLSKLLALSMTAGMLFTACDNTNNVEDPVDDPIEEEIMEDEPGDEDTIEDEE